MAIGNPITLTSNVASKTISVIATAGQTLFTVTGGYRINQLAVFRNGVRLLDSRDYEARNGSTVTLLSAATVGDALEFQVFDDFRVADAIVSAESEQTISGNLTVSGILTATDLRGSDVTFRHVKATGISTVSDTTQSTTTTTGALIVSGGVGVAKSLFVGGSMNVAGTLTYEDVTNSETAGVTTTGGLVVTGLGATFGSGVGIADSIYHIGDDNTAIRFPAADTFTVTTAGDERLRVDSSGNVLVGTTSANKRLTLVDRTDPIAMIIGENDNATTEAGLRIQARNTANSSGFNLDIAVDADASAATFDFGGSERLRIGSNGNVSIGGTEGITYSLLKGLAINVDNGDAGIIVNSSSSAHNAYISFGYGDSGAVSHADQFSAYIGRIGDDTLVLGTSNEQRLRITSAGNVGINSTDPTSYANSQATLVIEDTISPALCISDTGQARDWFLIGQGDGLAINYADGGGSGSSSNVTGAMFLRNNGNIGINESTPGAKLHIVDTMQATANGHNQLLIVGDDSGTDGESASIYMSAINATNRGCKILSERQSSSNDHDLIFQTSPAGAIPAERVRIDSSGRLLVGANSTHGINAQLQVRNDGNGHNIEVLRSADSANPPRLWMGKSRGSAASPSAVNNGDTLGEVRGRGYDGSSYSESASVAFVADATPSSGLVPGRIEFYTEDSNSGSFTERLRIDSVGTFHFKNGMMIENGSIGTTARNGTQNVDLDAGMVRYYSTASTGTWKPNFRVSSSKNVNGLMGTGDVISPTMIVAKGATSHYSDTIQVDGTDVTPEWLGGAPTDGGGSGTFDVYSYTIIKTGDGAFKVFGSVSTYE